MKQDLKTLSIKDNLIAVKDSIIKYRHILFTVLVSAVLGFMFIRIATMSTSEPEDYQVAEAKIVKEIKLNEDSIQIIRQLEDKNISIQTLFDPGRYDPFND
jgi:hypothetical protein